MTLLTSDKFKVMYLFFILSFLVFKSEAQTYDWLRSSVNEFWYNQFAEKCASSSFAGGNGTCSKSEDSSQINQNLSKDLLTKSYFDEALKEQSIQNQCQFTYWSRLNTDDNSAFKDQDEANKKLNVQFPELQNKLKSISPSNRNIDSKPTNNNSIKEAQEAQKRIVDKLVESSFQIAQKERELNFIKASNPVFSADPTLSPKLKIEKLTNEIAVLENSLLFSEDPEVSSFVKFKIIKKIHNTYASGKNPDLNELKKYFYEDNSDSFQSQVVNRKLISISEEQVKFSKINGMYDKDYYFKVATIQSGIGANILNRKVNQNSQFAQIQCDLDSKYGKGEKISSIANSVVIGGVTIFFGGAALMLSRLAQIGIATQRAAKLGHVISSVANTSISTTEVVKSIVDSCSPHYQKMESSICSRVENQKNNGIDLELTSQINHSECLTDLGLAALSGTVALNNFSQARKLKRDQQIAILGISQKYNSLIESIKSDTRLNAKERKQLLSELDRSISFSKIENFPRKEFLESIAKENPQDLHQALKEINNSVKGPDWKTRARNWISEKKFKKEDADELEKCLVDTNTQTSSCSALKNNPET
ncbi:MAG: hypothetical protein J0M15_02360 [Deltaproteobacteria bacterium]|nr:hypothetical protein [Deltaproteobacteria bacterium]